MPRAGTDARYVNALTSDSMSGDLLVNGKVDVNGNLDVGAGGTTAAVVTLVGSGNSGVSWPARDRVLYMDSTGKLRLTNNATDLQRMQVGYPAVASDVATKEYVDAGGTDLTGARRHFSRGAANIQHNTNTDIVAGWAPASGDLGNGPLSYNAGIVTLNEDAVLDVVVQMFWAANATGRRLVTILVNGAVTWSQSQLATAVGSTNQNVSAPGHHYAAGTAFQIRVFQDSGASLSLDSGRWSLRLAARE